ncbi:NADPH--cytochrome P450 reductase [Monoraphidium neglectum]|uniref:NADPH--hemoprotein reductase n=1 Tax=Monoraphidium neglectum TaxID=145388 RepID=A0A0D2JVR6_9CHLO|nr:NADPH--cytochrome P450 reductase [Monoraphidium neglectum]KIZ02858.1 NADPH--cytochrome P450 reductase [Monoraphidium neglectum]|eukprot:XP_013901877.1 NADPH--cytochrome P450 reductase [Monoraphidium neglectum]
MCRCTSALVFPSSREVSPSVNGHAKKQPVNIFLQSSKEELRPEDPAAAQTLEAASSGAQKLVLLVATTGAPLSDAVSKLPPLQQPPYAPWQLPVIGHALLTRGKNEHFVHNLAHNIWGDGGLARNGGTVRVSLPTDLDFETGAPEGPEGWDDKAALVETIMTCDPDVIAELIAREAEFPKCWNRGPQNVVARMAGNGLFTSGTRDPDWQTAHGILPRAFNALKIRSYYPAILDKCRVYMHAWDKRAAGGEALIGGIHEWMSAFTADAIVKCIIGLDMHNIERLQTGEEAHLFMRTYRRANRVNMRPDLKAELGAAKYYNPLVDKKAEHMRLVAEARRNTEEVIFDLVERTRRGEMGEGGMIHMMLHDKSATNGEYIRYRNFYPQLINVMVAGHETTSATLSWTLYFLAKNPTCMEKALAEIRDVLGDAAEPTVDHIAKLHYVEACFREALRIQPVAVATARDAAADTVLQGKWLVRRGQRVAVNLVALHRREDQWGGPFGDPLEYNPDRFMPGAYEKAGLPPRHPQAYAPWGFGVRACIGQLFALWEAKTFLAMLLPRFHFRTPVGYVAVASQRELSISPLPYQLSLHVRRREGAPATSLPSDEAQPPAAARTAQGGQKQANGATTAPAAAPAAAGHSTPLQVLFGSNSGMCEDFAQQLAAKVRGAGFTVTVGSLDLAIAGGGGSGGLPTTGAVAVLTSTYNGMPPDNAVAFSKWLGAAAPGSQAGVRYAVFGVGNSQWAATFQAFPKRVDGLLTAAGAAALLPLSSVDVDQAGVTDAFDEWSDSLVAAALSAFGVASPTGAAAAAAAAPRPRVDIRPFDESNGGEIAFELTGPGDLDVLTKMRGHIPTNGNTNSFLHPLKVLESRQLLPADSGRATAHVELELPEGMTYSAGDHLEVVPVNCPSLVEAALQLLGLRGDEPFLWTAGSKDGAARGIGSGLKPPPALGDLMPGLKIKVHARGALQWFVDLSTVPSRKLVAQLAEACPCPPEAAALRRLASEEGYSAGVSGPKLTLVELLSRFRSVPTSLPELVNALPRLAPRYYSISSSPRADPRRCSITVGLVAFTTPTGRPHRGASSGLIHSQPVGRHLLGTVRCLQSTFKLPKDPTTPIIMIGPGTGLAPMCGFMQERAALLQGGAQLGPALLFFGCRSAGEDYIYRDTLEGHLAAGVISGLHVAFSRDGPSKVYVQVGCEASAQNWMGSLLEAGRYLEDVWAG